MRDEVPVAGPTDKERFTLYATKRGRYDLAEIVDSVGIAKDAANNCMAVVIVLADGRRYAKSDAESVEVAFSDALTTWAD